MCVRKKILACGAARGLQKSTAMGVNGITNPFMLPNSRSFGACVVTIYDLDAQTFARFCGLYAFMSTAERVQRRLDVLSGHIRYQSAHSLKAERCSSGESRDEKQSVQRAYPQRR